MIKNLIIIIAIIGIVFLSQQPKFAVLGQNAYTWVEKKADPYTSKINDVLEDKIYPVVGGEVDKRKEIINQEINTQIETQKEKISETLAEKIKNYLTNVVGSIFFPGKVDQKQNNNSSIVNISPELQKCIDTCKGN